MLLMTTKIVGIALDDLQWATVTQFRFHYNASHPLVALNIRRRPAVKSNLTTTTATAGTTVNNPAATAATASSTSAADIDLHEPVSEKEFHKALPRYPNDGVLLIDVQRYNAAKVGRWVSHQCSLPLRITTLTIYNNTLYHNTHIY